MITVTIWHNVATDQDGRHTGMLDGYQPGDPMVRVFTYQADPAGTPEEIAAEAFGIFNGHPRDAHGADLTRRYYQRRLRSLSFPGNRAVLPEVVLYAPDRRVASPDELTQAGCHRPGLWHRRPDNGVG
jgi:hypothetical protein